MARFEMAEIFGSDVLTQQQPQLVRISSGTFRGTYDSTIKASPALVAAFAWGFEVAFLIQSFIRSCASFALVGLYGASQSS